MTYYLAITICVLVSLVTLSTLVYENDRLGKSDKAIFYLSYILIGAAALSEWAGTRLSGNLGINSIFLRIVKCCDYILTPMIGGVFTLQMRFRNTITKALFGVLAFNTIFQIISFFTGWMTDISPDNQYSHGRFYAVYVAMYLIIAVLVIVQFWIFGMSYKKQNRASLFLMMSIVLLGIALQEIIGGDVRTSYITITLGVAFMFIHTSEFSQQKTDEKIEQQKILITTDALTGLKSRYAYSKALDRYNKNMPEDMAVFSVDINGLKEINDTLGHAAGDELITGAASCIEKVFGEDAYRTGGDEFMVLSAMDKKGAEDAVLKLVRYSEEWHGDSVKELHIAIGYALSSENKGTGCEDLIKIADEQMYVSKEKYYLKTGRNRRRR